MESIADGEGVPACNVRIAPNRLHATALAGRRVSSCRVRLSALARAATRPSGVCAISAEVSARSARTVRASALMIALKGAREIQGASCAT